MSTIASGRPADLSKLFRPRSVAIIGASDRNPWSKMVVGTLDRIGFAGELHLVNPRNPTVLGRPAVNSCAAIGKPVDAAFLAVPNAAIPDALREMAASGIHYGAIVSSGFAEAGDEGRAMQDDLTDLARELGISILGPNSLGYINFRDRVALSAIPINREPIPGGKLGIVSQSGATAAMLVRFAEKQGIGLSYSVALGNEAVIDLASVISFLVHDDQTRAIAVFANRSAMGTPSSPPPKKRCGTGSRSSSSRSVGAKSPRALRRPIRDRLSGTTRLSTPCAARLA